MRLRNTIGAAALTAAALAISAGSINGDGPVLLRNDLSGETTSELRDVDGFTEITMAGSGDLLATEGDSFEMEVTADSA
ncbi:hypothetical protein [Demequina sp.]|uniref:hypothetical protein n=1 Tax=Demequina sp. TaxID=2050685 RepID=UPI0025C36A56|nr:hypothetical protein [Demequina sp.]